MNREQKNERARTTRAAIKAAMQEAQAMLDARTPEQVEADSAEMRAFIANPGPRNIADLGFTSETHRRRISR